MGEIRREAIMRMSKAYGKSSKVMESIISGVPSVKKEFMNLMKQLNQNKQRKLSRKTND